MKLKVSLQRTAGDVDLLLTADTDATIGDLADALATRDPAGRAPVKGDPTLSLAGRAGFTFDRAMLLVDSGIHSGAEIAISRASAGAAPRRDRPVATVTVVEGPDAGAKFPLSEGNATVGRASDCDVRLSDTLVSRRHVRVFVGAGAAEAIDLGSANGMTLNDEPVARSDWRRGDRLQVGDTVLTIELVAKIEPVSHRDGATGTAFNRSPVVMPPSTGETLEAPELPEEPRKQRFPVLPMIAPLLIGAVMFAVLKNPLTLLFIALSPMMMLANIIEGRWTQTQSDRRSMAVFAAEMQALDAAANAAIEVERAARNDEHPASGVLLDAAGNLTPLLWSRRPEAARFLDVRIGTADLAARLHFDVTKQRHAAQSAKRELDECVARYATVTAVPASASFRNAGSIGLAGDEIATIALARAVLCQLAALHSPAEVVISAFCATRTQARWDWLKWLPHTSSPHSPLSGDHLVSGAGGIGLLAELEALVTRRGDDRAPDPDTTVVVLVDADNTADRARLVELAENGPAVGVHCLWVATRTEQLPAACTTFVDVRANGVASLKDSHGGAELSTVAVEQVDEESAETFARTLAPVLDAGAVVDDASDLPRTVSWLELHEPRLADDPAAIVDRWQESQSILTGPFACQPGRRHPGTLRALIGQSAGEPHVLDLRVHGPHALLGGTTGAGKSELLQSWILAMAAAHSPQRVTFLLVDYKGGSAFSDCVRLPHTVGLVTDLSPHLVRRALVSLGAELTYRERLFANKKVKDLLELEQTGDPDTPPSLVIVVDEFAALVQEVPDFVDGVVNVAQRGRSLGLHLVLATQRPTGVIKDNLRANTNLRLALRMADEADSADVLGSPEAAHIDPSLPGRAVSKTGPGRLVPFQAAYVGGWTTAVQRRADVIVEELVIGERSVWQAPESSVVTPPADPGPTDSARVTATIRRANEAAQIPMPRRPWLDELAAAYELAKLPTQRRDDDLVFGVMDDPAHQSQPTVSFRADRDGNLAVLGTGGSGKSAMLRTVAIAAGFTLRGGPCHVYGLDFSSRGLDMLEELPHVGSIIAGSDHERIARLLRDLRRTIDDRASRYAAVKAATITEYRQLADAPDEPRILLLVDSVGVFRQNYEVGEHSKLFDMFLGIAADGRQVGVHVIVSADRLGAIPSALSSAIQRRVVLRLADDNDYGLMSLPSGVLSANSPPGRALLDDAEVQIAVLGGSADVLTQSAAIAQLAKSMKKAKVKAAQSVGRLPELVDLNDLPSMASGRPTIGVSALDLGPVGFDLHGSFLIVGPPGSGRTTALATAVVSAQRAHAGVPTFFFGTRRSPLLSLPVWTATATSMGDASTLAAELSSRLNADEAQPVIVVIEGVSDFASSDADMALQELCKAVIASESLLLCEAEVSTMGGTFGLPAYAKSSRSGLALQPDQMDGTTVFRTQFPRINRAEYPPGRAILVGRGSVQTIHVAMPPADPSAGSSPHSPDLGTLIPSQ